MKMAPQFYTSGPQVNAYRREELAKLAEVFGTAEQLWYDTWQKQGSKDEGSCCGGKGIQVWYLGPRKRFARPRTVVACNWVQGNVSAQTSVKKALAYLKAQGIEADYYDGWMD